MRICFISTGTFRHVGAYLEYFSRAGHEVHFIALSPSPPRRVPTYEVGLGGTYAPDRGKWKYPFSMLRARRLVRRLKPDIVHTHYATSGGLAGLVCDFRPTVVTAHGTDLTEGMRSRLWRALLKAVFEQSSCVNTVSSDLTEMALSLGVARSKVAELTLGVDTRLFHAAEGRTIRGGEAVRLICTRHFDPVYDHRTIVEALALLKSKGVRFEMTFVGEGRLRGELEGLVSRRGIGDAVTFLGTVGGGRMPAVLRAHDVYLSASRADGTSLSLLEAMAAGLFPVVSRIPANEAWLDHGAGGFLHKVGDAAELAEHVTELMRRPGLAASAAGLNRGKVVAEGDRTANMGRLERIYAGLVAGRPGAERPTA